MAKKKATPKNRIEVVGTTGSHNVDIQIGRHYFSGPSYVRRFDAVRAANRFSKITGFPIVEW